MEYERLATGGIPDLWSVTEVTAQLGAWSGNGRLRKASAARLAEAFSEAAEEKKGPGAQESAAPARSFLGETGKDLAAEVMAQGHRCTRQAWAEVAAVGDAPPESFRTDILRSRVRP